MKKLILFGLCVLLVAAPTVFAGYSYTVSGKVTSKATGLPVSGAVVYHYVYFSAGTASGSVQSGNDGSFSFNLNSDVYDYIDVDMKLTASKGNLSGATTWTCAAYSETKNVTISTTIQINPGLGFGMGPENFAAPGVQSPSTAVVSLDSGTSANLQEFTARLVFDPTKMMCDTASSVVPVAPVAFSAPPEVIGGNVLTVYGTVSGPLPIGPPETPTELFTVVWDVLAFEEAYMASVIADAEDGGIKSEFVVELPGSIIETWEPILNQTDYLIGELGKCKPTFLLDSQIEWQEALEGLPPNARIRPMFESEWDNYMEQWEMADPCGYGEGAPYLEGDFDANFCPAGLYVYEGGGEGGAEPNDAGLVMYWGSDAFSGPENNENYASAYTWDFGMDPDLRNSTIRVSVTPPSQCNITAVSFAIQDINGNRRSWWWSVPAAIPYDVPTTVVINTAVTGTGATTPQATGYMNTPGFNLAQSQFFDVDENFNYIFGLLQVPPPGQLTFVGMWNYWHNLMVVKNTDVNKGSYTKYSQPPDVIDSNDPKIIRGWDEISLYGTPPIVADDWLCSDERPVTDIHW